MNRVPALPRLAAEWLLLTALLAGVCAVGSAARWWQRLDALAYDSALALWQRPAPAGIVVIAIDDNSLRDIGRWPWSRALHASVIDKLCAGGARAILLDLILAEPDTLHPQADRALRDSMARCGRVVLPLHAEFAGPGQTRVVPPLPELAAAAAALGHIHLPLDDDGVARRLHLREQGSEGAWPHLVWTTLQVARGDAAALRLASESMTSSDAATWRGEGEMLIPYGGPSGHLRRISYAALLRDEIPPEAFQDRIALIGATGTGMGDSYPTPVSGSGVPMPGVEIMGHAIAALEKGWQLREVPAWVRALLAPLPVLLLMAALLRLPGRLALVASALGAAAVVLFAALTLRLAGWWMAPSATVLALLSAYPLWSWRRLEAVSRHLQGELSRQRDEVDALARLSASPPAAPTRSSLLHDAFAESLSMSAQAAQALTHARHLLTQSLAGLPAAVAVCDVKGRITLANTAAHELLDLRGPADTLHYKLQRLQDPGDPPLAAAAADWKERLHGVLVDGNSVTHQLPDRRGRNWQVNVAPYARLGGRAVGLVATLVDVTELQRLQREERELLQFLSHDLRAPHNAMLALVDLARQQQPATPLLQLLARIERHAEHSLSLIDALLMQQRADRLDLALLQPRDLTQIVHDVADQVWPVAQAAGQQLILSGVDASAWVQGDGELLTRALANLAHNASKYSPHRARIELRLRREDQHWLCEVQDDGPGIEAEYLQRVFEPHFRVPHQPADGAVPSGHGLGLAFVQTVVLRHGGAVAVHSVPGQGTRFSVRLPALADPDDSDTPNDPDHEPIQP